MESPAELAARRLAWEIDTRKSVELQSRLDILPSKTDPLNPPAYDAVQEHYIETAAGQRSCDSRYMKSNVTVSRYGRFSDGSKSCDVTYSKDDLERQETVVIKRQYAMEDRSDRMERPDPLQLLYVGREPLHKALPKATYLGEGQALERDCSVFLFSKVRWEAPQDHVYYLDKTTSIPLKVESFRDQAAREANKPLWVWTAESLDKVQDHFVPLKSKMIGYSEDAGPDFTWSFRVNSIAFDKEYPASSFWPTLQPGVSVLDTISNKRYQIPGTDTAQPTQSAKPATTAEPIHAVQPSGSTTAISIATFGLGAAILLLGVFLWWRRQ